MLSPRLQSPILPQIKLKLQPSHCAFFFFLQSAVEWMNECMETWSSQVSLTWGHITSGSQGRESSCLTHILPCSDGYPSQRWSPAAHWQAGQSLGYTLCPCFSSGSYWQHQRERGKLGARRCPTPRRPLKTQSDHFFPPSPPYSKFPVLLQIESIL